MTRPPFCETHAHFHDMKNRRLRYSWLEWDEPVDPVVGEDGAIRAKSYTALDFKAETRFQGVRSVVHVQCALGATDPVEETRWLQECADRHGIPHGIIGYVDLARADAAAVIDRHKQFPNFRGVRDLRYDEYLSNPAWRRGYALLGGLVCCDDPFVEEMPLARRLAEDFPEVTLCLDHAGYPEHVGNPRTPSRANFKAWREGVRELAKAPNAVVKISGLGQSDHQWTVERIRPWVLECIEAFGVERSFFGCNWPVDRLYSSYGDVLDAYAEIINGFSRSDQEALFFRNAEHIFKLNVRETAP